MLKSGFSFSKDNKSADTTMSFEAIGQKLKSAREAQGLSLRQVFERTKIPLNHLQAIELGVGDDLPEPVYVSGFIKRYAECVGLNGQVLGDEYRKNIEEHSNKGGKHKEVPVYISSEYIARSRVRMHPPVYKLWVFNGLIIVGLVGLLCWFYDSQMKRIATQPDSSLLSLRDSTTKLNPQPAGSTGTVQPGQATTPLETSTKVSLTASRHVWVEVKKQSTGESIFTGYLEQGDRRDFEDPQGLTVRAGDGGSLSVEHQGKIESFGLPGKVVERAFAPSQPVVAAPSETVSKPASRLSTYSATSTTPRVRRTPSRSTAAGSQGSSRGYRRIDDGPSRQYVPGESLGGGHRNIDVPYRYSDGRLDAE